MPSAPGQQQIPIVPLTSPPTSDILAQIVSLHQESITHDNALMRFHPPFTPSKTETMSAWWAARLGDLGTATPKAHHVFLAISPPSPLLTAGAPSAEAQIVGIAELLTPASDTGQCVSRFPSPSPNWPYPQTFASHFQKELPRPSGQHPLIQGTLLSFRAEVEMLMVSPSFRGRGLARRLMGAVEECALAHGRTLLTLGTTRDSDADRFLYPALGYTKWGVLPSYGEVPDASGRRVDGVYYYKDLRGKEE